MSNGCWTAISIDALKYVQEGNSSPFFCAKRTLFSTESDDKEIEIHV